MKKMKKLLSMLLTVIMVLAMAAPSFAANNGSITIENAAKDRRYTLYKIFDATIEDDSTITDNTERPTAYRATSTQKNGFEALGDTNPFVFSTTANADGTYAVTLKEDADVVGFLQSYVTEDPSTKEIIVGNPLKGLMEEINTYELENNASSASLQITGLAYGYYLITSSKGAVITLNSANPSMTVKDKSQTGPSKEDGDGKFVIVNGEKEHVNSASYGDTVNFEVQFTTRNYVGEDAIEYYYVTDTIDAGLSYVLENGKPNITVKAGETADTAQEVSEWSFVEDATTATGFKVQIPWNTNYAAPGKLIVTYSATVNTNAELAGEGNKNTATVSYKTAEGSETDAKITDTTTTYTFALAINKIDGNNNGLADAEFELYENDGTTPLKVTGSDGVYTFSSDTAASNKVTSPASGLIIVKGVKAGTYQVKEVKAPAGYNLVEGNTPVVASVDSVKTYTTTFKAYRNAEGKLVPTNVDAEGNPIPEVTEVKSYTAPVNVTAINVENLTGTILPSTGGIGTTIFYAAGIILMAGAVFFVVRRKRA